MFAPSAAVEIEEEKSKEGGVSVGTARLIVKRLGHQALKIRVRNRITADGGRSVMAV